MAKTSKLQRLFPILGWLPNYQKKYFGNDVAAGVTVGIMLIPQGMAYAMIAGLPPVFGLYASLIPQVIYAITGTSRQLAVGPVAMDSLLVAAGLGALSITGVENYIAMAVLLAFIMGTLQVLLGVLRMGFLVNFLSKPVISGFTSAAAIIIGLSQLKHLLGAPIKGSNQVHKLLMNAIGKLDETNFYTLAVGLIGIVILVMLKKYAPKLPRALFVVVFGILAVMGLKLHQHGVSIVENVPDGLPAFQMPALTMANVQDLFPIAATLALIAFMEAISVAKAIEEKHDDYEVEPNQELIALGLSNIFGSFFQSYPTTGGFSRTAVNEQAGAKTGLSAIVAALVVGVTLLFLTPLFYYLPHAVLASIIMVAVFGLIDFEMPVTLFKTAKGEFGLLIVTFLVTLLVGIKEGILTGVFFSLLLTIYKLSQPHVAVLGKIRGTDLFRNIDRFGENIEAQPQTLIVRFDAPLFFGNKDFFRSTIKNEIVKSNQQVQHLILNAEAMSYIDSSGLSTLGQVAEELNRENIEFYITDAIGPVRDMLYQNDIMDHFDQNHFFSTVNHAVKHIDGESEQTELHVKISRQNKFQKIK